MIKLNNGYVIDADNNCYIVGKLATWKNKKTGEVKTRIAGQTYHSTMQGAIKALMAQEQREAVSNTDMTLSEAVQAFKTIERALEKEFEEKLGEA